MYYGGFSYSESYSMPVSYKRWFIERIAKELSKKGDNDSPPPSRADSAEMRALQGRNRAQPPARLRRFT